MACAMQVPLQFVAPPAPDTTNLCEGLNTSLQLLDEGSTWHSCCSASDHKQQGGAASLPGAPTTPCAVSISTTTATSSGTTSSAAAVGASTSMSAGPDARTAKGKLAGTGRIVSAPDALIERKSAAEVGTNAQQAR